MALQPSLRNPRLLAFRTKPVIPRKIFALDTRRFASHNTSSENAGTQQPQGPNQGQLPHVTEEQAAIDKSMGETPPDVQQGTPVQEVLERDKDAQEKAPEVLKQQINKSPTSQSGQSRSFSTMARRAASGADLVSFEETRAQGLEYPGAGFGHKFPLPDLSQIKKTDNFKSRYDDVVDQVTKSIMRHGKLSQAQSNMSIILDTLRTAPPPQPNPAFPGRTLLTDGSYGTTDNGSPSIPRDQLPLSPIQYLSATIDSLAPLIKIRQQRGMAGGGAALPIPMPLGVRQRRRQAIQWILQSANSRRDVRLADRVAKEIINVAEGKSSAWEKRALVNKLAVSARSNIRFALMGPRGGRR